MTPRPLLLFDLDGTLVDSAPDIARAMNATLRDLAAPPLPVAQVVGYVGDGARKLLERAVPPAAGPVDDQMMALFRRHYAAGICVESRPYPGVTDLLAALRDAGAPLAVLTNKPGDLARALLSALSLDGFFADVVGDGDGWPRKPAPDGARALLARHGTAPADAWIVGDGLPDLQVARAAGCRVAAAAWGYTPRAQLAAAGPDVFVERPSAELAALLLTPGR